MFDSHIHTKFSTDSQMDIEAAINKAAALKIGLITTDHMDLKYPVENKFIFDVHEYFEKYSQYRGDNLLIGIELGLRNDCYNENLEISAKHQFDYVLGSLHLINGIDIYDFAFQEDIDKKQLYLNYFECMYQCVRKNDFIDSLAHIDYIARYVDFKEKENYQKEFLEIIDEILKVLASTNKALEINTRRLGNLQSRQKLVEIYKRFSEHGGKFVTIGSDAHNIDDIGKFFNEAVEISEICGLKIVHFKERKIIVS